VSPEQLVDNLIEAGWHVIDTDFDMMAFTLWRKQALDCIGALMGPAHAYTHYFRDFVEQAEKASLLIGSLHVFRMQGSEGYEIQERVKEGVGKGNLLSRQSESVWSHFGHAI